MFKTRIFYFLFLSIEISVLAKKIQLNSADICILPTEKNKECSRKSYGKYSYPYACTKSQCAVNKSKCDDYLKVTKTFDLIFKFKYFEYSIEMKHFNLFNSSIAKCPSERRTWQTEQVCLNRMDCHHKMKSFSINNGTVELIKKKPCPCNDKHSFYCGRFCTSNKQVCKQFTSRKIPIINIKSCSYYRTLAYHKFIL